jgi:hypothetical protein
MNLVEDGADPDVATRRDRLDLFDLTDDLELHFGILDRDALWRKPG